RGAEREADAGDGDGEGDRAELGGGDESEEVDAPLPAPEPALRRRRRPGARWLEVPGRLAREGRAQRARDDDGQERRRRTQAVEGAHRPAPRARGSMATWAIAPAAWAPTKRRPAATTAPSSTGRSRVA